MKRSAFIILLFLLSSCGGKISLSKEEGSDGATEQEFLIPGAPPPPAFVPYRELGKISKIQNKANQLDLIYSIDNSGSMGPYIDQVERNIAYFVDRLIERGVEFQIALLNSSNDRYESIYNPYPIGNPPIVNSNDPRLVSKIRNNFKLLKESFYGGIERPVGIILDALSDIDNFGTLYREGTGKVLLALTNADEYLREGQSLYLARQKAIRIRDEIDRSFTGDPWNFTLIGSPDQSPCPVQGESGDQRVMKSLSQITGGVIGRICDRDYGQNMDKVIENIFALLTVYKINHPLTLDALVDGDTIKVFINDSEIKPGLENGYYWNTQSQEISFPGETKPQPGDRVEISFDYIIR